MVVNLFTRALLSRGRKVTKYTQLYWGSFDFLFSYTLDLILLCKYCLIVLQVTDLKGDCNLAVSSLPFCTFTRLMQFVAGTPRASTKRIKQGLEFSHLSNSKFPPWFSLLYKCLSKLVSFFFKLFKGWFI